MTYRLDGAGQVAASLDMRVAAQIARVFSQRGVQGIEATGGALTGAEITGMDAAPAMEVAKVNADDAGTDRLDIEKKLARSNLRRQHAAICSPAVPLYCMRSGRTA